MTLTLAAFAILQALDVFTTILGLRAGAHEGNPVVAFVLAGGGSTALVVAKIAVVLWAVIFVLVVPARGLRATRFAFQLANVLMVFVVLSNAGLAMHWSD